MTKILDGKNAVLGRLATAVAKELLKDEQIVILNSEKIIITGKPKQIVSKYLKRRRIGSPQHGPFFPKKPNLIVRRTVRGMLPKSRKGIKALKKLRVYESLPEEFKDKKAETIAVKEIKTDFITIKDLSKALGSSD